MIKTIQKILLSSLSVLLISVICWTIAFLNPNMMYAHQTSFDLVTVYHNETLEEETENIIQNALKIIRSSELYDASISIDLCLNEDSFYPQLHPFKGGVAYSFLDKSIIYRSTPNFGNNTAEYTWAINNYERRTVNLTWLLAHEFTHNLQYNMDPTFIFQYEFWQQEGYAEYISRQWKADGKLKAKIQHLLIEEKKPHQGLPAFLLADGTSQILSYYKYGLAVQFLIEEENLDFRKMKTDDRTFDQVYTEMVNWSAE